MAREAFEATKTWWYFLPFLQIPDLGLLEIPSLPDTCLYRNNEMEYSADAFKIEPVTAMKEWKLSYDGKMRYMYLLYFSSVISRLCFFFLLTFKCSGTYATHLFKK